MSSRMNQSKKIFLMAGMTALLFSLTFVGYTAPQKIVLQYGELNPQTHPMAQGAEKFAELVNKSSHGRIEIKMYFSGQLGDEKSMAQLVQMGGTLDMMRIGSNTLGDFGADKMSLFALPYVFKNRAHMMRVINSKIGAEILKNVEESNAEMIGLMFFDEGARHFFFRNKVVSSIKDMKNLKIRVPETQILMDTVKAFGASPTPISFSELYSALQTGVVDGAENPITGYLSGNYYEVGKYYTLDAHTYSPSVMVISKSAWSKLAPQDKKIIMNAAKQTEQYVSSQADKLETDALKQLKAKGAVITDIRDKSEWQKAVVPVYEKYGKKYKNLLDAIKKME
ncbi:MAG TPA: C4-dicarboxylate ABC transporter [Firmicutes bacterium]|jgi:TRAP-type transport system periplasmic protein|nr:C4-dicarboxylate ABC transporter [Bacillota bacterium]